jgi:hypothetical protein
MPGVDRPGPNKPVNGNHVPMIGSAEGSVMHGFSVDKGMSNNAKNIVVWPFWPDFTCNFLHDEDDFCAAGSVLKSTLVGSLEQDKGDSMNKVLMATREGPTNMGLQDSMGIASSPRANGKVPVPSWSSPNTTKSPFSLSLIESSSDIVSVRPTTEEVIAFGGIPKASTGVRSSNRLGGQPNVDLPQMEKAMKNAQLRDASFCAGKPLAPKYSIVNIPDSEIIHRADRLGVSLGKSDGEVVKSIKGIKMVEEEQILTILQKMWLRMRIRKKVFRLL